MNLIRISYLLRKPANTYIKTLPLITRSIRLHRDWQPGPYPETEEERLAAAKKYLLLPEEYEPCTRNPYGTGVEYGDYPKVPLIHYDEKSPYYAWDYLPHRKNYKEAINVHQHFLGYDTPSPHKKAALTVPDTIFRITLSWILLFTLYYVGNAIPIFPPICEAHMPVYGEHYYYPYDGNHNLVYL